MLLEIILPCAAALVGASIGAVASIYATRSIIEKDIKQQRLDRKHRLSMAAIDKRLTVHQEAFTLWNEAWRTVHGPQDKISAAIYKARQWWAKNCLYLEPSVNEAFLDFMWALGQHSTLLATQRGLRQNGFDDLDARLEVAVNWNRIRDVDNVIFAACELPSFSTHSDDEKPNMYPDGDDLD